MTENRINAKQVNYHELFGIPEQESQMKKKLVSFMLACMLALQPASASYAEELILDESREESAADSEMEDTDEIADSLSLEGLEIIESAGDADLSQPLETETALQMEEETQSTEVSEDQTETMAGEEVQMSEEDSLAEEASAISLQEVQDTGDLILETVEEAETIETDPDTETVYTEILSASGSCLNASALYKSYSAVSFTGCYGNQLSATAKTLYNAMVKQFYTNRKTADVTVSVNSISQSLASAAAQAAYDAVTYDYPEIFWIDSASVSYTSVGGKVTKITLGTASPYYSGALNDVAAFDAAVDSTVNEIKSLYPVSTDYEKVKAVHDWLCDNITYEESENDNIAHTPAGVFLRSDKKVVCEGYAKAFMILCRKLGVPAILVVGYAGGPHMWNYVQMNDGAWYLVDCTWDDQVTEIIYSYFLVGTQSPSKLRGVSTIAQERVTYSNFSSSSVSQSFAYPVCSTYAFNAENASTASGAQVVFPVDSSVDTQTSSQSVSVQVTSSAAKFNVSSIKLKKKQSTTAVKLTKLSSGESVISWTSSNTSIAKVKGYSNGSCKITAKSKTGTVKITAKLSGGQTRTLTVKVQKSAVACTSISGIPSSLRLKKGATYKLKASISPITCIQKVSYSSSKKSIAKVNSSGKITAKKTGSAVITVKCGKKKVKCKVTVTE